MPGAIVDSSALTDIYNHWRDDVPLSDPTTMQDGVRDGVQASKEATIRRRRMELDNFKRTVANVAQVATEAAKEAAKAATEAADAARVAYARCLASKAAQGAAKAATGAADAAYVAYARCLATKAAQGAAKAATGAADAAYVAYAQAAAKAANKKKLKKTPATALGIYGKRKKAKKRKVLKAPKPPVLESGGEDEDEVCSRKRKTFAADHSDDGSVTSIESIKRHKRTESWDWVAEHFNDDDDPSFWKAWHTTYKHIFVEENIDERTFKTMLQFNLRLEGLREVHWAKLIAAWQDRPRA